MHNFLLIHDDVIDKSSLRRGKPTLHRAFNKKLGLAASDIMGANLSIVTGDIIFALEVDPFGAVYETSSRKEAALRQFLKTAALQGAGAFLDVVSTIKNIAKPTANAPKNK